MRENVIQKLDKNIIETLRGDKNVISAHCHNRTGGGYVDFGLIKESDIPLYFEQQAKQVSAKVLPTSTIYNFEANGVALKLTFTTPLLYDDLTILSRPVSYISYEVESIDNQDHEIQIFFETTPEWAVDEKSQLIESDMFDSNSLRFIKSGTLSQDILGKKGDDVRIDWGYFYMVGKKDLSTMMISSLDKTKELFTEKGHLDNNMERDLSEIGRAHT